MKQKNSFKLLFFLLSCWLIATMNLSPANAAGLLITDGGFGAKLKSIKHDVKVTINNGIAVTETTQVFKNDFDQQVDAIYTFPLPQGASVASFSIWLDGREMIGEVLEEKKVRRFYSPHEKQRCDASLFAQTVYRAFAMGVSPIAAHAEQKIKITYYQELANDNEWTTYVYPLATTTRKEADLTVEGQFSITVAVKSAIAISQLRSPSHQQKIFITERDPHHYETSLQQRNGELTGDVVLALRAAPPVSNIDLLTSKAAGDDGYFLLTLTMGKELEQLRAHSDYVFIVDTSDTMGLDGKLVAARNAVQTIINTLSPNDRFAVLTFAGKPKTLFNTLLHAQDQALTDAAAFLASLRPRGDMRPRPALQLAYTYATPGRPLNVVLISSLTSQENSAILLEMMYNRPPNSRFFCVGAGYDVNRLLLQQMAWEAGGLAAFIPNGKALTRKVLAFQRQLIQPLAIDLNMDRQQLEIQDIIQPHTISSLFHGMRVRVYGRYHNAGTGKVTFAGKVDGRSFAISAKLRFPETNKKNLEIKRMWAEAKMKQLQNKADGRPTGAAINELTRLGQLYTITSNYTAFIVLPNDAEYQRWHAQRLNRLRMVDAGYDQFSRADGAPDGSQKKSVPSFSATDSLSYKINEKTAWNLGPWSIWSLEKSSAAEQPLPPPLTRHPTVIPPKETPRYFGWFSSEPPDSLTHPVGQ